jgi:hypothetical protein
VNLSTSGKNHDFSENAVKTPEKSQISRIKNEMPQKFQISQK